MLITVTDGMDNQSQKYKENPQGIGNYLSGRFNYEPTNFPFLIGVGNGGQIDRRALAAVREQGGFPALLIDAFPVLTQVFVALALQVSHGLQETVVQGCHFLARKVRQGKPARAKPSLTARW